jgi:hypothetical protein
MTTNSKQDLGDLIVTAVVAAIEAEATARTEGAGEREIFEARENANKALTRALVAAGCEVDSESLD